MRVSGIRSANGNWVGLIWEPGVHSLAVASRDGWALSGSHDWFNDKVIWWPDNWSNQGMSRDENTRSAWTKILEQAVSGCPVAYKALCDVVLTNDYYAEYKETMEALADFYADTASR